MKSFRLSLIIVAAGLVAGTLSALAAPAKIAIDVDVRSGPDFDAPISGFLANGTEVDAQCDQTNWCMISGGGLSGWVNAMALRFPGQPSTNPPPPQPQPTPLPQPQPWPQPQPPRPTPPPVFEEAGACFYSERNFGGASFCLEEGDSYNRLQNWNDRIRSVQVFGGSYVDLCSDRNLGGSCVTLQSNTRRLPSQLDRRASSLEVY